MSLPMDKVNEPVHDGKMLMSTVDISNHSLRGQDLYLYACRGCGMQTLLDYRGGTLTDCGCPTEGHPGVTVTIINQLSSEERAKLHEHD